MHACEALGFVAPPISENNGGMIVTHTQNISGSRRVYLSGKGSLEAWIEPSETDNGWTFHLADAVAGNELSLSDHRACAIYILLRLAETLAVSSQELAHVPFERIAALHSADPFAGRRAASPKRRSIENAFLASAPDIRRPINGYVDPATYRRARGR
jgi:hypothetical protein